MSGTVLSLRAALLAAALSASLASLPGVASASSTPAGASAQAGMSGSVAAEVQARLNKKQFAGITVTVDANGIATLSGATDLYEFKADADKRAHHVKGVTAVRNLIQVVGPSVSDADLKARLGEKLAYDRVGYGNLFNAITLGVENGVVTLGGHARTYIDRDSALALVSTYPGVKDVINDIEVDPPSPMDDRIRLEVARAVYGYPSLNKYSIDPQKPIRISVQNGNVELYGNVDSQSDKDTAFIRANGVPGVFTVKNYIQVNGQTTEARN